MSDREDSPERQENGSHQSNGDHARGSQSPGRSISRSRKRHHSRSRSSPRDRRSPYEGSSYGGRGSERPRGVGGGSTTGSTGYDGNKYREPYPPGKRSRSRSPMSGRRRHTANRENPPAGRCLGIFGLSIYTQERDLHQVFSKYGPIEDVQIVYDAQTGRSRGFSFVYFKHTEDAKAAKDNCNGIEIDGRKIRVDFSITQRAHTPTPGIYMGKPSHPRHRGPRNERGDRGGGGDFRGPERVDYYGHREPVYHHPPRERSPSPYYREKRRYPRSRSRSYSPRLFKLLEDRKC